MPKKIAPSADELAQRSEHQQSGHLDPADRSHFWQHPATEHDPYPEPVPAEVGEFPHWLHKRSEDGSTILESRLVHNADAHQAAIADGFSV